MSVAAKIRERDVTASSFWFVPVSHRDEEWTLGDDGQLPLRTLKKIRLIECGPVALPAYIETTVHARDPIAKRELLAFEIRLAKARAWTFSERRHAVLFDTGCVKYDRSSKRSLKGVDGFRDRL